MRGCILMNSKGGPPFGGCTLMNSRGRPPLKMGGPPLWTIPIDLAVHDHKTEASGVCMQSLI